MLKTKFPPADIVMVFANISSVTKTLPLLFLIVTEPAKFDIALLPVGESPLTDTLSSSADMALTGPTSMGGGYL